MGSGARCSRRHARLPTSHAGGAGASPSANPRKGPESHRPPHRAMVRTHRPSLKHGSATAYIGLGANLGDAQNTIDRALDALPHLENTRLIARSSLYSSDPVGYLDQPPFINAVAAIETSLEPKTLLERLLSLETHFGRIRSFRNAPRALDLDLLLYGNALLSSPTLTLPHPRMHERAFVLIPLIELCPGIVIPGQGAASALVARCIAQRVARVERSK